MWLHTYLKDLPMTKIIVDSKILAYLSLQRREAIIATLSYIENAVQHIVRMEDLKEYEVIMCFDYGKSRYRAELLTSY